MSSTEDTTPFLSIVDTLRRLADTIEEQNEIPEYISKILSNLHALNASSNSLSNLLTRDFPNELRENITQIQIDVDDIKNEIQKWSIRHKLIQNSILKYIPLIKPFTEGIVTVTAFHAFNSTYTLIFILFVIIFIFSYFYLYPEQSKLAIHAWKNEDKELFDELNKKIDNLLRNIRSFADIQDRIKNSKRSDAIVEMERVFKTEIEYKKSNSSLLDKDREEAINFWANKFGSENYSVPTEAFIDALCSRSFIGPLSESRRITLHSAIKNVVDINEDGYVSVEEFCNVLFLFGPLSVCLDRLSNSLICRQGSKDYLYSWFSWLSLARADIDTLLPKQGESVFVVRLSSQPYKFAISYLCNGKVYHSLILASHEGYWLDCENHKKSCHCFVDYDDEEMKLKLKSQDSTTSNSFNCTCKDNTFYLLSTTRLYPSLAAIITYHDSIFIQPFVNWEHRIKFNVGGTIFETKVGIFFKATEPTELGDMFSSPSSNHDYDSIIFLDRNPLIFSIILDWYRTGHIYIPPNVSPLLVRAELRMFYNLPISAIEELESYISLYPRAISDSGLLPTNLDSDINKTIKQSPSYKMPHVNVQTPLVPSHISSRPSSTSQTSLNDYVAFNNIDSSSVKSSPKASKGSSEDMKSNYVNFNSVDLVSNTRYRHNESSASSPENESVYVAVGRETSMQSFRSRVSASDNASISFSEARSISNSSNTTNSYIPLSHSNAETSSRIHSTTPSSTTNNTLNSATSSTVATIPEEIQIDDLPSLLEASCYFVNCDRDKAIQILSGPFNLKPFIFRPCSYPNIFSLTFISPKDGSFCHYKVVRYKDALYLEQDSTYKTPYVTLTSIVNRLKSSKAKDNMASIFNRLNTISSKYPFGSKVFSSFTLWGVGDSISQHLDPSSKNKKYDYVRTLKMSLYGGIVFTLCANKWYTFLGNKFIGSSFKSVASKVILDQTIFAPLFLASVFTYTSVTEGLGLEGAKKRIDQNLLSTLIANWMIWPAVQAFNLGFVPPQYQILVVNVVAIPWNTYMAYKSNKKIE